MAKANNTKKHTYMQIFITDTTIKPIQDKVFTDYFSAVKYLEGMSQRAYGQNRKERMILLESVGHGDDDPNAVNFVRSMSEQFSIGIIREGQKMRCDITAAFMFDRPEYGN